MFFEVMALSFKKVVIVAATGFVYNEREVWKQAQESKTRSTKY